jgi:hypothetical protein
MRRRSGRGVSKLDYLKVGANYSAFLSQFNGYLTGIPEFKSSLGESKKAREQSGTVSALSDSTNAWFIQHGGVL